jgi:5S rRNA maturation endonuclease (ribonuclease M5)
MNLEFINEQARSLASRFIEQGYKPQGLHHYTDENGEWVYSRMRLNHPEKAKIIRPFHKENDNFIFGEPKFNGKKPLYQLPLIKDAETIFWVEGERKVDVLVELGLVATTSGGATSHEGADFEPLRGKRVIIWADFDESGKSHAKAVKSILEAINCEVLQIDVDSLNLPPKGDVVDWIEANRGATKQDILRLPLLSKEAKVDFGVILRQASELKPKPINWLWDGWIAGGKFHLLGGVAGTGKTTISLALASIITNGGKFPDGFRSQQGNVVIWTGEDDVADTLTPRLIAMGANLERIFFVEAVNTDNGEKPFNPSTDIPTLQDAIAKIDNVKLLIIDPIVSVIKGDSHKNAEVRKDLSPLIQMAESMGFAIIGITHFSKGTAGREPIERITGSLAFGAVARIVLAASRCKTDDGEDIRIFLRAKSNIGADNGGFEYSLDQTVIEAGIETSRVVWGSAVEGSARDLLVDVEDDSDGGCMSECMQFLSSILSDGEVRAAEIKKDCNGAGYSISTMNRAKKKLGIQAKKIGIGSGSYWVWELPKVFSDYKDSQYAKLSTFGVDENLCEPFQVIEREI